MARLDPYTLQMQISRMFEQGQSFFCTFKVQDWLRERNQNPDEYDIAFNSHPAPAGSPVKTIVEIQLSRKDGQSVDPWLQEEINRHS